MLVAAAARPGRAADPVTPLPSHRSKAARDGRTGRAGLTTVPCVPLGEDLCRERVSVSDQDLEP